MRRGELKRKIVIRCAEEHNGWEWYLKVGSSVVCFSGSLYKRKSAAKRGAMQFREKLANGEVAIVDEEP